MNKHKSTAIVLVKTKDAYQLWHKNLANVNRINRQTITLKIDNLFLALLEFIFAAKFACDKFEKLSFVSRAIAKNDLLQFFLQIGWENEAVPHSCYSDLVLYLEEIGRMLGGWKKDIQKKLLPADSRRNQISRRGKTDSNCRSSRTRSARDRHSSCRPCSDRRSARAESRSKTAG